MIPLKLEFQGIYSYKEKATIDFKQLMKNKIFGIFGKTGSGKSSIIECMLFALYGKAERLDSKDRYNILNLDSNSFFIDFTFEQSNGNKNDKYRIYVRGERAKNDFNKVQIVKRIIYKYENNEWIPINKEIEDIIGIDYENFRRIIIVPQGKFQEILSLDPRDKAEMMKKLFILDKYDLFEKAKQLEQKNNEKISEMMGKYENTIAISIPGIPYNKLGDENTNNEIIKTLNENKNFLHKKIDELSNELKLKEEKEKELIKNKEIIEKKNIAEKEYENLKKQLKEYEKRKKEIEDYKNAKMNFSSLIEQIDEKEKEIKEKEKELALIEIKIKEKEKEEKEVEEKFNEVKNNYEKREEIKQKAENLKRIIEIMDKENELEKIKIEYKQKCDNYLKTKSHLSDLKNKKEKEKENLENIESNIPDLNIIADIREWFEKMDNLKDKFEKEKNEKIRIEKEIEKLKIEKEKIIKEFIEKNNINLEKNFDIEEIGIKIKEKILENEKEIEEINEKINELSAKEKLAEYSRNLKDGLPCPLCGSLIHPKPLDVNVSIMLKEYKERQNECKKQREFLKKLDDDFRNLEKKLMDISGRYNAFNAQIKNIEDELKKDEYDIINHEKKFIWKTIGKKESKYFINHSYENYLADKTILEIERKNAIELRKKIEEIKKNLEYLDNEIKELEKKEEEERNEKSKIENEISSIESIIEDRKKQINFYEFSKYKKEDLLREISELEKIYSNIETEYKNLDEKMKNLKSEISELIGSRETTKKYIENIKTTLKNLNTQLNDKISKSKYSIEEIRKILTLDPSKITKDEEEIENFMKDLHNAEKNFEMISKEAEGKFYDEKEYEKLINEIKKLKNDIEENKQKIWEIENNLEEIDRKIKNKKEIEKELEKLKFRGENIKILKGLFEGKGFVNFVSKVYLKNLCEIANERFQKFTSNHLQLDVDEKNEIIVKDLLNGGKVRKIDSLSGGEKFLASLSLSMALSEIFQSFSKNNQNFFFIDEGFGNLDKNLLSDVMKILENLTKENLIIGIISHVEEIKNEIDYYLKVEKDEIRGSLIKESWKCI